jgi:hypothetical protein
MARQTPFNGSPSPSSQHVIGSPTDVSTGPPGDPKAGQQWVDASAYQGAGNPADNLGSGAPYPGITGPTVLLAPPPDSTAGNAPLASPPPGVPNAAGGAEGSGPKPMAPSSPQQGEPPVVASDRPATRPRFLG